MPHAPKSPPLTGLLVAIATGSLWIGSLIYVCKLDVTQLLPVGILPVILGRTFIQTGLFIVAHDAIHGSVLPGHRQVNQSFGRFTLALFILGVADLLEFDAAFLLWDLFTPSIGWQNYTY
ncbi:hypothetical protein [Chamaesiphon sp. OTE_75_metabat_556]|uniref:hypothetical protein n=1 Tax=Chamaesiphon sp. OTE_75_metabat_556 TaxID=2964692 RepID=UPI00286B0CAE|nr:hypothetical protein [Chamaesiphon sp. OTE_75_metabat_556]